MKVASWVERDGRIFLQRPVQVKISSETYAKLLLVMRELEKKWCRDVTIDEVILFLCQVFRE
jgi:hypothetical protein